VTLSSTVVAVTDQVSTPLAGATVILHLGTGFYLTLNAVGSRIWTLVQHPVPVESIRDTLVREYDVAPGRCEEDLLQVLQDLAQHKLIEVRPGTVRADRGGGS